MAATIESIQSQMKQEVDNFQGIQKRYKKIEQETAKGLASKITSIQKTVSTRQKLDAQLNENKVVLEELNHINDGSIYKLIGPVLVKQDPTEAKDTVTKRIEYINKEIERHDKAIKDLESKFDKHKQMLGSLQQQFQQLAMQAKTTAAN